MAVRCGAGRIGQFLHARQRCGRSGAGALPEGRAAGVGAQERSLIGSRPSSTPTRAPSKDPKIRRWNPLGFKIVDFVTEPEAPVDATGREGAVITIRSKDSRAACECTRSRRRRWRLLFAALHAETVPPEASSDSRIRYAPYNGDQVYRLRGFVGYQIDLEFEPGETFVGLGAATSRGCPSRHRTTTCF